MEKVLAPIVLYSKTGITMISADSIWHCCYPIFAVFIGNYPKQVLVTCIYNGRCPKYEVSWDQLSEYKDFPPHVHSDATKIYHLADNNVHPFNAACREAGLKPVYHPFWLSLPFADVYQSIAPDILYQLLQGIVQHLVTWLSSPTIFGSNIINAQCRILPLNHSVAVFPKGIAMLSCISGKEHKNMCRILLGLIIGLPLSGGQVLSCVIKAVCAILDFVYLAQLTTHTTDTLRHLQESLELFHSNKAVFIDLGT